MVLLDTSLKPIVVRDFEAEIKILNKTTCNLAKGYESVIHCGVIRQTAAIIETDQSMTGVDKSNNKGLIKLRFKTRPEYIKAGTQIFMREGKTKALGVVTQIFPEGAKLNID